MSLAGAQAARADVFCEPSRDMFGGICRQNLGSTVAAVTDGGSGPLQSVLPNSRALSLQACSAIGCDLPLEFTLDLKLLDLPPAALNDPEKATRVDVMQLGVLSHGLVGAWQNGYRVLAMSILHGQGDDAYMVGFSWREEYEPTLPIMLGWNAPGERNSATAVLSASETRITVKIGPVESDWSDLGVDVHAFNGATQENRQVPLIFLNTDGFRIPHAAEYEGFTQPWSLRSGVIGGNISKPGMTTQFVYRTSWIRAVQSFVENLPPPDAADLPPPDLPPPDSFD